MQTGLLSLFDPAGGLVDLRDWRLEFPVNAPGGFHGRHTEIKEPAISGKQLVPQSL